MSGNERTSGRVVFYHLTRSGLAETLLMILGRARDAGWAVMVRGMDRARLEDLDTRLWVIAAEDSFLPHAVEGGAQDADQPILLGLGTLPKAARGLVLVDGAETSFQEAGGLERVWVLFDGASEVQLSNARGLWTRLTTEGMAAQYWSEETGRWQMKAEKTAAV
jgi:DNA polymerase-3 subunit chi